MIKNSNLLIQNIGHNPGGSYGFDPDFFLDRGESSFVETMQNIIGSDVAIDFTIVKTESDWRKF